MGEAGPVHLRELILVDAKMIPFGFYAANYRIQHLYSAFSIHNPAKHHGDPKRAWIFKAGYNRKWYFSKNEIKIINENRYAPAGT